MRDSGTESDEGNAELEALERGKHIILNRGNCNVLEGAGGV